MQIRRLISVVVAVVSAIIATTGISQAQFADEASPFTIGTDAELKLNQLQIKALVQKKGLPLGSDPAKQISKQFAGQGVDLNSLKEKEVLDIWQVLTPEQREILAKNFKPNLLIKPQDLIGAAVPFWKGGPSPFHIPPNETTPPPSIISNGNRIPIDQIKTSSAMKIEADACETASVPARAWVGIDAIEPALVPSYEQSLNNWVNECLTQDVSDNASLGGLDPTLVQQVVGVISYGETRFCTGLLKDGVVITARHCFMRSGKPAIGKPATWTCPRIAGKDDLWCTTEADRSTLQFRRASDPSHPIPLSLAQAGISVPSNFGFQTDRISVAVRADSPVSLSGIPKVEWDAPQLNDLVWLAGPVVSATQAGKYKGMYWSKFLAGKCRIVELEGQCVRHYCQAVGGFSGSPMVTETVTSGQGIVKVAGIHLGASESYKECKSDTIRLNIAQKSIQ